MGYRYTIIDEADELLDADWETDFNKIMSGGGMIPWYTHN